MPTKKSTQGFVTTASGKGDLKIVADQAMNCVQGRGRGLCEKTGSESVQLRKQVYCGLPPWFSQRELKNIKSGN